MEKKSKTKPSTNGEERKEDKSKGSFKERRKECLSNIDKVPTVNIKGKEYSTVAERHRFLLKYFPETRVDEQIFYQDEKRVITKTTLYIGDTPYAVGHAEEKRDSSFINKTSALENCLSSSLGRCLAAFGLHGSEYASAEELANAVKQQANGKDKEIPIEQMTTTTKLNALYSNWKKEQDEIQIRFTNQEKSINEKGGQYGKKDW
jgi:hypothetical protein|tara:strand:+ start:377 stop:991 length:615 start_codon:yes stop_codon:yes gene_type:complete